MKLIEIAIPPPLVMTLEGFSRVQDEQGRSRIQYTPDTPDDPYIKGTMDRLRSTKLGSGKSKLQSPKNSNVAPFTHREKYEMDQQGLGNLPKNIPVFYGYNLTTEPTKMGKEKYATILDALKGRKGHSFDPEALNELLNRSVNGIHKQIEEYGHGLHMKDVDKIIILPTPSSSTLSKQFTEKLASSFKDKPVEVHDILEPNLKHDVGIAHGKKVPHDRLKKVYKEIIINDFLRGARDEYEVMDWIDQAEKYLHKHISQASKQDADILKFDLEALEDAKDAFFRYVDTPQGQKALARKRQHYGPEAATRQRRVHDVGLGLRNLLYNRIKIKQGAELPSTTDNTLIIIADDNIDKGGTIGDVYRTLAKAGIVRNPGVRVVGAVIHRLGKAKGDFSKELAKEKAPAKKQ